jgi:PAS domain S-box-containing protein
VTAEECSGRARLEHEPGRDRVPDIRESERRFRQLFEIASDYYWEMDAAYRMSYLSPNYEAMFGIPISEMLGKRFAETPGLSIDPEMGRKGILAQKAKQPYRDLLYSRKMANGSRRWFSTSAVPIFDDDGVFRGYRGVAAEVTARVEAEDDARLARRRLHDALSLVSQPFGVYDGEDRLVTFNQAFTDLHTTPDTNTPVRERAPFRALVEWQLETGFYAVEPGAPPIDREILLARFATEEENSYRLRDGRWMLVVYRRLPGNGRVGLWTDITPIKNAEADRRRLEGQLHHARRLEALGTLAGGIAHGLNNALVPIISLTKLVARGQAEGSRERAKLETVLRSAEQARVLVEQLLLFSRQQTQGADEADRTDLPSAVIDALNRLRASLPANIRLEEAIAPTSPIEGAPGQVQQVLVNIVTNAVEAIGDRAGTVLVELRPSEDGAAARLSVSDTGCGMDEATRQRIFEPFFTTKPVGEGTGLGLAVVHGIVSSLGGCIDVTSTPGRGSRFDIVMPIKGCAGKSAVGPV